MYWCLFWSGLFLWMCSEKTPKILPQLMTELHSFSHESQHQHTSVSHANIAKQVAACFLSASGTGLYSGSEPKKNKNNYVHKSYGIRTLPWTQRFISTLNLESFNLGQRIRVTNKRLWLHCSSLSSLTCSNSIKPDVTCLTVYWLWIITTKTVLVQTNCANKNSSINASQEVIHSH